METQQTSQVTKPEVKKTGMVSEPHVPVKEEEKKEELPKWMNWVNDTQLSVEGTDGVTYILEDKEYMYISSVYNNDQLKGMEELETVARLLVEPKGIGATDLRKKRSSTVMRLLKGLNTLMDLEGFL